MEEENALVKIGIQICTLRFMKVKAYMIQIKEHLREDENSNQQQKR